MLIEIIIILHLMESKWETTLITVGSVKRQRNYLHELHIFSLILTDREISHMCLFEEMGAQNISRFQTNTATDKGTSDKYRYCLPYAGSSIR